VGPFYEKKEKMLSYYTRIFRSVEIDSTFYRYPTKEQIYGYNRTVPGDFVFAAKLPRILTHDKLLDQNLGVQQDLSRFLELMAPLQNSGKLGAILIQLPPSFTYESNLDNFTAFIEILPKEYDFAVEFRDSSWLRNDIWKLLSDHNVAYTIVDEPRVPSEVYVTADFSYIRWHGHGKNPWYNYRYTHEELEKWIPTIRSLGERVHTVYGYFNNHYHGYAPENCIEVLGMLEMTKPEQIQVKEKIVKYNSGKLSNIFTKTLEDYSVSPEKIDIENLVLELTDKGRLERSIAIKEEELKIGEVTEERVLADIRGYIIQIDIINRIIVHNCDDWKKSLDEKRLCKHLCKLFLSLQKEKSIQILRDIIDKKGIWKFQYV
jgi:uncharacterized protein YecE (DUF72 family)